MHPAGTAARGPYLSTDGLSQSGKTTLSLLIKKNPKNNHVCGLFCSFKIRRVLLVCLDGAKLANSVLPYK